MRRVMGVQELADSAVIIRSRIKTQPIMQWAVRREFYRRVKKRFDYQGIEMPFPHTTLYFGEDQDGQAPAARHEVGPGFDRIDIDAGFLQEIAAVGEHHRVDVVRQTVDLAAVGIGGKARLDDAIVIPVSYTHLTLPAILLV